MAIRGRYQDGFPKKLMFFVSDEGTHYGPYAKKNGFYYSYKGEWITFELDENNNYIKQQQQNER
jgi:hypothetical protein